MARALLGPERSEVGWAVLAGVEEVCDRLAAVHLPLVGALPEDGDPRQMPLPTILVVTKVDAVDAGDVEVLEELYAERFPVVRFSVKERVGFQRLKLELWRMLELIRVYTKPPGKKAERSDPFVLNAGSTVLDLADLIHGEMADKLVYAKVWGGQIQGQKVAKDFELRDRDLVTDAQMLEIIERYRDPAAICTDLVELAT